MRTHSTPTVRWPSLFTPRGQSTRRAILFLLWPIENEISSSQQFMRKEKSRLDHLGIPRNIILLFCLTAARRCEWEQFTQCNLCANSSASSLVQGLANKVFVYTNWTRRFRVSCIDAVVIEHQSIFSVCVLVSYLKSTTTTNEGMTVVCAADKIILYQRQSWHSTWQIDI